MRLAAVMGALAVPSHRPVRVTPAPRREDVAAMLSQALRGSRGAVEVQRLAREIAWGAVTTDEHVASATDAAVALRDRCAESDAPCAVLLAVMRSLLDDSARAWAEAFDRAITAAAREAGVTVTPEHEQSAARIIAEVLR